MFSFGIAKVGINFKPANFFLKIYKKFDSRFDICIFAKSQAAHWFRSETDKIADNIADDRDNALGLATKDNGDVLVLTASDIGQ